MSHRDGNDVNFRLPLETLSLLISFLATSREFRSEKQIRINCDLFRKNFLSEALKPIMGCGGSKARRPGKEKKNKPTFLTYLSLTFLSLMP